MHEGGESMKNKTYAILLPILISIAWYWVPVFYTMGLVTLACVIWVGVVGTLVLVLSAVLAIIDAWQNSK